MSSTNTTINGGGQVHILVFPYPAQGHMLPLLDLTHQLSLINPPLITITILITPKNLPFLNPLLSSNPLIKTLILPFPNHPLIPRGLENVKDLGNQGNVPVITALSQLQGEIICWFNSHDNPPIAILSDFFLGWTHQLAQHLGIKRLAFYSSGAFLTAAVDPLWADPDGVEPGCEVKLHDLPGSPSFKWEHVPSVFRRYRESEPPRSELLRSSMVANSFSWASVFNTFEDLEGEFLDCLKKKLGHQRVFGVGPLNLMGRPNELSSSDDDDVFQWLDKCDDFSVLYVCFGSQRLLKKAQVDALAVGLEKSGVRFIWALKELTAQQVTDGYGQVPDGYEERVVGRGFVIKGWAPQGRILTHRAVGGFLSHCGWNSVLEGVSAGVMILGWPMEADQFVNAKLLVDYKRVGIRVCEGAETVPDPDELGRVIARSMHGSNVVEGVRAKELKAKAHEAVKVGGSSSRELDRLVHELSLLLS